MAELKRVSVDCETTGTDSWRHRVWEVGMVDEDGDEYSAQIALSDNEIGDADPKALEIGRFEERYFSGVAIDVGVAMEEVCRRVDGKQIIGSNPTFDWMFLLNTAQRSGYAPLWNPHYRPLDVLDIARYKAFGAEWAGAWGSVSTDDVLAEYGIVEDRHTALGDARAMMRLYKAL